MVIMIPSNHLVVRETRASRGESNEGVFTDRGRCETRQPMAQTTQFVGSPALDSLQMTGLMLAWLLTYLIVCAVNGSVPSVERAQKDVPSHVLSFGGVASSHSTKQVPKATSKSTKKAPRFGGGAGSNSTKRVPKTALNRTNNSLKWEPQSIQNRASAAEAFGERFGKPKHSGT